MRFDEQKIFATTMVDLRQVTADVPVVMRRPGACDSEGTDNGGRISRVLTLQVESMSAVMMLMLALVIRIFGYSSGETEDVTPLTLSMSTRLEWN